MPRSLKCSFYVSNESYNYTSNSVLILLPYYISVPNKSSNIS